MDIYVGSIPFKWKERHLYELFAPFGEVSETKIIIDKITRQNKGFGFVIMPNAEEANAAIQALNGSEHEERKIVVNISLPKSERPAKQRHAPSKNNSVSFKSDKHKKSLPPWKRKEY